MSLDSSHGFRSNNVAYPSTFFIEIKDWGERVVDRSKGLKYLVTEGNLSLIGEHACNTYMTYC